MRIFGDPLRTQRLLKMAGMKEGEVIESGMLTRQIEKAQRKVESHNFDIRKNLLLFDDVANDQRKVVYQQRTEIMGTEDLSGAIHGLMDRLGRHAHGSVHAQAGGARGLGPRRASAGRARVTWRARGSEERGSRRSRGSKSRRCASGSSRRCTRHTTPRWRAPARPSCGRSKSR